MKAFELIEQLTEIKKQTEKLSKHNWFGGLNNKSAHDISELIEEIDQHLKQIDFATSEIKPHN